MIAFRHFFPEIAAEETRGVTIGKNAQTGIPSGDYGFEECYCIEEGCDCQRVILLVLSREEEACVAAINHSFRPVSALPREWGCETEQTYLDPLHPMAPYAPELLAVFNRVILTAPYSDRLKRHYSMVRELVDNPRHPRHNLIPGQSQMKYPVKGRAKKT